MVGIEFLCYKTCIWIPKDDSLKKYDDWFINGGDFQPYEKNELLKFELATKKVIKDIMTTTWLQPDYNPTTTWIQPDYNQTATWLQSDCFKILDNK